MTPQRLARTALAGLLLATAGASLASCSDDVGSSERSADGSPTASATGVPFGAEFEGPDTADAGEGITTTITNTGRLPDAYQLSVEPPGAATIGQQDFTLSPEESIDVQVTIRDTPLVLVLKSVGGGGGERVADLEVN